TGPTWRRRSARAWSICIRRPFPTSCGGERRDKGVAMATVQDSAALPENQLPAGADRPAAAAKKALAASTIGYAMDGFDLLILGFMLAAIRADLGLTPAQGGSLLTWTLIG